ncbi:hypothetical protein D3C78_1645280 [compost metagenome]
MYILGEFRAQYRYVETVALLQALYLSGQQPFASFAHRGLAGAIWSEYQCQW